MAKHEDGRQEAVVHLPRLLRDQMCQLESCQRYCCQKTWKNIISKITYFVMKVVSCSLTGARDSKCTLRTSVACMRSYSKFKTSLLVLFSNVRGDEMVEPLKEPRRTLSSILKLWDAFRRQCVPPESSICWKFPCSLAMVSSWMVSRTTIIVPFRSPSTTQ